MKTIQWLHMVGSGPVVHISGVSNHTMFSYVCNQSLYYVQFRNCLPPLLSNLSFGFIPTIIQKI